MRLPLIRTLLLLTFCVSVCPAAETRVRFSAVKPGERLEIRYTASGCFYWESADFTFYPDDAGYFSVREKGSAIHPPRSHPLARARVNLERGERAKLDELLDVYRAPVPEGVMLLFGPAHPSLHLKHYRGRQLIAEEILNPTYTAGEGPLTFGAMLAAVRNYAQR